LIPFKVRDLIHVSLAFLRPATCNLKCTWCDTKYTWDGENYDIHDEVAGFGINEIVEKNSFI